MKRHYRPATFAYDASWLDRAKRAGGLDGFHGYPKQEKNGIPPEEVVAYEKAYAEGLGNVMADADRARLRRAANKAKNISDPAARAAALRKVRRLADRILEKEANHE